MPIYKCRWRMTVDCEAIVEADNPIEAQDIAYGLADSEVIVQESDHLPYDAEDVSDEYCSGCLEPKKLCECQKYQEEE